jgi:hypothetical protein
MAKDAQDKRYGSPQYIQGLLNQAEEFESIHGDEPSFWERIRQQQNEMNDITPIPRNNRGPAGPSPTTPSWERDQSLTQADVGAQEEITKLRQLVGEIEARIQYLGAGGVPTNVGPDRPSMRVPESTGLLV